MTSKTPQEPVVPQNPASAVDSLVVTTTLLIPTPPRVSPRVGWSGDNVTVDVDTDATYPVIHRSAIVSPLPACPRHARQGGDFIH